MEIRHFIKFVTLTLGFALISLLITTETQAQTTVQNDFSCINVHELSQLECAALVSIYDNTDGDSWVQKDGWLTTDTPCSWYGVTCSDGSVTDIKLNQGQKGNGLSGILPDSIKYFKNLNSLDVGGNRLRSIPAEIGDLFNLTTLSLYSNELTSVPSSIGNLSKLTALSLSSNQLTSLPAEIGNLSNLVKLTLWNNHLNSVPASIGNLSSLERLSLSSNRLTSLPAEIGNLSNLKLLYIDANQLSSLPAEISNLTGLTLFHLAYNRITNLPPRREDDKTQTLAPTNLVVNPLSENSIELTWDPIVFAGKNGAYEINIRTTGDFTIHGTTENKSSNSYTINGLAPGTNYSFRVRTYTLAHGGDEDDISDDQHNNLWSEYSQVVFGRTHGTTSVPPTSTPSPTLKPPSTSTPTSTDTPTPTPTLTPSSTSTSVSTPTNTPTKRATDTPTFTLTSTPTSTATPTGTPTSVPTPQRAPTSTPPVCYQLTLSTDGSGKVPTVSPNRSPGCARKHYTANEFIELNARPAVDWITDSWMGTSDDSREANVNTLTMPDSDHIVVAIYTKLPQIVNVEPVDAACPDTTPAGEDLRVACLAGMVYFNGQPATSIGVTITNSAGESASIHTQKREDRPEKRPHYLFELNSDPLLIEAGQEFSIHVSHNGISKSLTDLVAKAGHQQIDIVLTSSRQDRPIATINHLPHTNFDKDDQLIAYGMGQVQHRESDIQAYLWESNQKDEPLSETKKLDYYTSDLEHGKHQLSFQVQDRRGVWSNPVQQNIYVSNQPVAKWTMLLYLAADYHLDGEIQWNRFDAALTRIGLDMNSSDLRVAALIDGYKRPAERWSIEPGSQKPKKEELGEVAMDEPDTLAEFIKWGQDKFPAEHYYLVIADHGQGVQGVAWDSYSDARDDGIVNESAYLTVHELEEALTADDNVAPIDVLHLDACSMNLLETAYEVRESVTDVLISSQYLGWNFFPYDRYADLINSNTTPIELGEGIVKEYSQLAMDNGKPYTLSALNMKHSPVILDALDELAEELAQRLIDNNFNAGLLSNIRENVQSFYSGYDDQKNPLYLYIDLKHWATLLRERTDDSDLGEKAADLIQELDHFIIEEQSGSGRHQGATVDIENASGISIFYPEIFNLTSYQSYINDELFEFTQYSQWINFLEAHPKSLGPNTPMIPLLGPLAHLDIDDLETADPPPSFGVPQPCTDDAVGDGCRETTMLYLPIIQR